MFLSLTLVALYTWKSGVLAGPHFADFKRSAGPFAESWRGADVAGGFLAIFTPFLFSYFLFTKRKIMKLASFIGALVCLMGLFTTYSRGSILALAISSILMILISTKHLLKTSKVTAFIILITFIGLGLNWRMWIPQSIIHRVQGTTVQEETYGGELPLDESSLGRIDKWKAGLEIFKINPLFGVGLKIPEYVMETDTHNSFIQIAAEMGIFGFLVFILLILGIFIQAKSLLETEFAWLGIGFIGCLIAFIFVNMFYSNFFRDTVVGTFWVMLGMLVASKQFTLAVLLKKNAQFKSR
jgi:O-antigen ligase